MLRTRNDQQFEYIYRSGHIDRYTFEFNFLACVLPELYKEDKIDDYVMIHPSEWKKILIKKGVRSDFGIDKVSVEKLELPDDRIKFIFTLPKPKATPDCFFTMIIFEKNKNFKYYTLELDIGSSTVFKDGGGIICGQEGGYHLNYGRRCRNDSELFQKSVQDIIDGKPEINDGFNNIDVEEFKKKFGITPEQMKQCLIF